MPRRARLSLPGIPWHIIQRGNNRSVCFFAEEDYRFFLYASSDAEILGEIRQSTNGNLALGNERFKKQIEKALGRRARRGKSGRPRQQEADDAGIRNTP